MKFTDVVNCLLSRKNCSLTITNAGGGTRFIEDLHAFVRIDAHIVHGIKDKHNSLQAKMTKETLVFILEAEESKKFERGMVGAKPKKKR
jgi:hypothetical protein